MDNLARVFQVNATTEVVAAEPNRRDAQTGCAEVADFQLEFLGSEGEQAGDILATFCRRVKIERGADRNNTRGIDPRVALVVVALDVNKIDSLSDTGDLIDVAGIGPYIFVIDDPSDIAFEVAMIDGVEAHQRCEQANVSLGERVVA